MLQRRALVATGKIARPEKGVAEELGIEEILIYYASAVTVARQIGEFLDRDLIRALERELKVTWHLASQV